MGQDHGNPDIISAYIVHRLESRRRRLRSSGPGLGPPLKWATTFPCGSLAVTISPATTSRTSAYHLIHVCNYRRLAGHVRWLDTCLRYGNRPNASLNGTIRRTGGRSWCMPQLSVRDDKALRVDLPRHSHESNAEHRMQPKNNSPDEMCSLMVPSSQSTAALDWVLRAPRGQIAGSPSWPPNGQREKGGGVKQNNMPRLLVGR